MEHALRRYINLRSKFEKEIEEFFCNRSFAGRGDRTLIRFGSESLILSSTTPINFFIPPPLTNSNECSPAFKTEIDQNFKEIYEEIESRKNDATMAFPLAFAYSELDLQQICVKYRIAIDAISGKAIRTCRSNYRKFDETFSNLEYPCGYGTQSSFFRYIDSVMQSYVHII